MTDEERRKLVEKLRESTGVKVSYWTCLRAANEIERLAKQLKEIKAFAASQSEILRSYMDNAERMYAP